MVAAVSSSSARSAVKRERISVSAFGAMVNCRDCASEPISARTGAGSRRIGIEQQPLEIRRNLDIHRGRRGRRHAAHLVGAGLERAHQNVVDVGRDHQPLDRQAHARRHIAGEHVAEIAGRHREGDLAVRRAKRDRRGEVVDDLRDDARPVDRVDAGEPHPIAEAVVVEQALHDRLAIVERAFDRKRVHIRLGRRRHHAPLHVRDAAVRIERDHVDLIAAAERLDGRAAGIARGRDHDGGTLAALDQRVIHQPRQELHREVLEGERRTVKQLQHEGAGRKLRQRHDRRMAEGAVGVVGHAREIGVRDGPADEGPHDFAGDLRVRPPGEAGDLFGGENAARPQAHRGRRRGQAPPASRQ